MSQTSLFEIRHEKPTRSGSIPEHWDIYMRGNSDSMVTVWIDSPMAEFMVECLEAYAKRDVSKSA